MLSGRRSLTTLWCTIPHCNAFNTEVAVLLGGYMDSLVDRRPSPLVEPDLAPYPAAHVPELLHIGQEVP